MTEPQDDHRHEERRDSEWRASIRNLNRVTASVAGAEGLLLIGLVAGTALLLGAVTGAVGWVVFGGILLLVFVGGLIARRG